MLVVYNNHQVESLSRFSARFCWLHSEGDAVDPLLNVTELNKKKNFLSFLILYKRLLTQGQFRSVRIEVTSHTYKINTSPLFILRFTVELLKLISPR